MTPVDLKQFATEIKNGYLDENGCPDMNAGGPPVPSWGAPPTVDSLRSAIEKGQPQLPPEAVNSYVKPLVDFLPKLLEENSSVIESLVGAVYQHADECSVRNELKRVLLVVDYIYQSYLDDVKREQAQIANIAKVLPLAAFSHRGGGGPTTITADKLISSGLDTQVSIVTIPTTYRNQPILWASLAHETGGHDVLHSDPNLLPELKAILKDHLGASNRLSEKEATDSQLPGQLWSYWIDEAAADCFAMLNIGPSFQFVQTPFFSALLASASHPTTEIPYVRTVSRAHPKKYPTDPPSDKKIQVRVLDPHPTDILRIGLTEGVLMAYSDLDATTKYSYSSEYKSMIKTASNGATEISLHGKIPLGDSKFFEYSEDGSARKFPIDDMMAIAREVGSLVVTTKLKSLDGKCIQDLVTWTDKDELAAQEISTKFLANEPVPKTADPSHLLAGGCLAASKNPSAYAEINKRLELTLDSI